MLNYSKGVRHGFCRKFAPSCWNHEALESFSKFAFGLQTGIVWKSQLGGGYLVGKVDSKGKVRIIWNCLIHVVLTSNDINL